MTCPHVVCSSLRYCTGGGIGRSYLVETPQGLVRGNTLAPVLTRTPFTRTPSPSPTFARLSRPRARQNPPSSIRADTSPPKLKPGPMTARDFVDGNRWSDLKDGRNGQGRRFRKPTAVLDRQDSLRPLIKHPTNEQVTASSFGFLSHESLNQTISPSQT